jgi:type IV secretion system protein VirB8
MDAETEVLPVDERAPAIRETVFREVIAVHQAEMAFNRERSRAGWWVGGIGAAIGLLGVGAATISFAYNKPEVRYDVIDYTTGAIRESFGARDAPSHFSERVIRHYLAAYIGLRERYVWQLDPQTFHLVTLMSSPAEQKRYAEERQNDSPASKYGHDGYARVIRFVDPASGGFRLVSKGADHTYEYDVQFLKGEVLATDPNRPVETWVTARIIFQFHPEITMNQQDRLDNEAGLYVISYSVRSDK